MSIGILSGMGAEAGAHFYSMLIKECQRRGAKQDCDFPEVVLYNFPFNGTDQTGIASVKHFKEDLLSGINKLNSWGVNKIVITCNTAHLHLEELQSTSSAEILNIVEITQRYCKGYKCGVICSRTAKKMNLFSDAKFHTTESQQITVDRLIQNAISGAVTQFDKCDILNIISLMFKRGAQKVILGCTELPLVLLCGELSLVYRAYSNVVDVGDCTIRELLKDFEK